MVFYSSYNFKRLLDNKDFNLLFNYGKKSNAMFDRTGAFTKIPNLQSKLFPLSAVDFNKKIGNFEDIAFNTAERILKEHDQINLFWSGGIDSSVALLAFDAFRSIAKHKITIKLTEQSIIDGRMMFDTIVKDNYEYDFFHHDDNRKDHWSLEYPNVNGDCSDYVINFPRKNEITTVDNFNKSDDDLYRLIEETIPFCPINIKDDYDLSWWMNINFGWHHEAIKYMVAHDYDNYKKPIEMTLAFYSGEDWQAYAYQYHDEIKRTPRDINGIFKIEHLKFINSIIPNHEFSNNVHPRSLYMFYYFFLYQNMFLIDDNFNKVRVPNLKFLNLEYLRTCYPYSDEILIKALNYIENNHEKNK